MKNEVYESAMPKKTFKIHWNNAILAKKSGQIRPEETLSGLVGIGADQQVTQEKNGRII